MSGVDEKKRRGGENRHEGVFRDGEEYLLPLEKTNYHVEKEDRRH